MFLGALSSAGLVQPLRIFTAMDLAGPAVAEARSTDGGSSGVGSLATFDPEKSVPLTSDEKVWRTGGYTRNMTRAPVAPRTSSRTASLSSRGGPAYRPKSTRKIPRFSAALFAAVAAGVIHAAVVYMQCYRRLRSTAALPVQGTARPSLLGAGSAAIRRLAWGGRHGGGDPCLPPGVEVEQYAWHGEKEGASLHTSSTGAGQEDEDRDLEEAVEAELARLRSLSDEEESRPEETPQFYSGRLSPSDDQSLSLLEDTLRLSLSLELELMELLEQGEAIADRAVRLRTGSSSYHASPSAVEEKAALAAMAKRVVIRATLAAERLKAAERKADRRAKYRDVRDLLPAAESADSWPLPDPYEPFDANALVNVTMVMRRASNFLEWAERTIRRLDGRPGTEGKTPVVYGSIYDLSTVRAFSSRLRQALPGLARRRHAWRAAARNNGFKLLNLSPHQYPGTKAFSLLNRMTIRLSKEGLPSRVEEIVLQGGLDAESAELCREALQRRLARLTHYTAGGPDTGLELEAAQDDKRVQSVKQALEALAKDRWDARGLEDNDWALHVFGVVPTADVRW